jgi:hypothetical protein
MRTPHNDSATSRDAAEAIRPVASSMVRRVFEFLVSRGSVGATDSEMQEALTLPGNTQRPRRRWLVENGFVRDSGETRPTPSGCKAVIWIVTGKRLEPPGTSCREPVEPTLKHCSSGRS